MNQTEPNRKRAHIYISGRVQGVGFRHFTQTTARAMNLTGWVKNLADGRVEAVIEGPEEKVKTMVEKCRQGPRAGRVENIDLNWEDIDEKIQDFGVKYA